MRTLRNLIACVAVALSILVACAAGSEVATDVPERQVGLFYFLWLGEHGRKGPYDVTKILEADPDAGQKPDSPLLLLLAAKRLNMV